MSYTTLARADSPLFSYSPAPGFDLTQNWVTAYLPLVAPPAPYYTTSAPSASVQFDWYGDAFELVGPGTPGCNYTISVNGAVQNQTYYSEFFLGMGQWHVELDVDCSAGGEMGFGGVIFQAAETTPGVYGTTLYVDPDNITTYGQWETAEVYAEYYGRNFTQYETQTYGSQLAFSFQGMQLDIIGSVGPEAGDYAVTIDGQTQTFSADRPVDDDNVILWFEQFLDGNALHEVEITSLGEQLTILALEYYFPVTTPVNTLNPVTPA